jgi:hypothetical protein
MSKVYVQMLLSILYLQSNEREEVNNYRVQHEPDTTHDMTRINI